MSNYPIFSIIVPVYNVEPYLEGCLKSIANQTFKNIEVILVYDPLSSDKSLDICKKFLEKYSNFFLYFSEKNGAGAVRNYGLDKAKGELICFVDGDDRIEPSLCADMKVIIDKSGADFVNFGFNFVNNNGKVLVTKNKYRMTSLEGERIFHKAMLDDDIFTVIWNKVYVRSFLTKNQICFPQVNLWEDILFTRKVAFFSKKTYFVPRIYYHALVRNNSNSRAISSEYLLDGISLLKREHKFIISMSNGKKFENLFKAHFVKHISFYLLKCAFQVQSWHEYQKCFVVTNNSEYSNYIKELEVKRLLPLKNLFVIFICNYPRILRVLALMLKIVKVSPY